MLLLFWIMSLLTRLYAEINVELRAGETCFLSVLWLYHFSLSYCCSWCWAVDIHPQPGRKLMWYTNSLPCFLIHTDLNSNPASFYSLSNRTWWKHQTALTGWMYTNSWEKETKGGILKGMGKKWVSVHLIYPCAVSCCQRNALVTTEPVLLYFQGIQRGQNLTLYRIGYPVHDLILTE